MAEPQNDGKEPAHHTIDNSAVIPIYLTAILLDIFSIIPLPVIGVFGNIVMTIIWLMQGIFPWSKKNWVWYLATWVMEFLPFVSALPMFTLAASRMIAISRINDKLLDDDKMKRFVSLALRQKGIKNVVQGAQNAAVVQAGMRGRTADDKYGREARKEKREGIASKRSDLDKSLERKEKPKGRDRGNQTQSANDNEPEVDGIVPFEEEEAV